jgi:hypothetical protein
MIIIGIRDLGTIFMEVSDMDLPKLHPIQRLLSMGLPQVLQLKVDKTHYMNPADKEVIYRLKLPPTAAHTAAHCRTATHCHALLHALSQLP